MKKIILIAVSLFVVGAVPVSFSADYSPSLPAVKQYEGVPYISGGIGDEELAALRFIGSQYNLKLVFAFKSGEYLADITVQIKDAAGRIVLDAVSDGPYFFTRLTPEKYTVIAAMQGKVVTQKVQVHPKGQSVLYFYW